MTDFSANPENLRDAFAASLDWWREAGVEEHVGDESSGWLRRPEDKTEASAAVAAPAPPPPPEPPEKGALSRFIDSETSGAHPGDPDQWPNDPEEFRTWWMESEAVDPPGAFPRVAPQGDACAQVMLIIDQPDRDGLLSAPAEKLASNMLRAMGFAQERRYFASILPRHTLRPDWPSLAEAGYGKLLLHHIALTRPQRVIACGNRVWSLLAHETAQEPAALTNIAIDSASIPAFAMPDLATLLRSPDKRAQTWTRWLDWSDSPR